MDYPGWILTYRRPDLDEDCYAGPFASGQDAWTYADNLPADRTDKKVEYGSLRVTPKEL